MMCGTYHAAHGVMCAYLAAVRASSAIFCASSASVIALSLSAAFLPASSTICAARRPSIFASSYLICVLVHCIHTGQRQLSQIVSSASVVCNA